MLKEFREFAMKGNVVDLAVGVIIGAAFGAIVSNLADAKKQGAVLAWGNFLTLTLNFTIIAFVLFLVIRLMNQLKRRDEAAPAPPKPSRQEELLTEIRDLLKKS